MANNAIIKKLDQIKLIIDPVRLANVGTTYMKSITPIDSGNARRNTRQEQNVIHADYPYAERLDSHWSKQFYGELIKPTTEFLTTYVQQAITQNSATPTMKVGSAGSLTNSSPNKPSKTIKKPNNKGKK